MYQRFGTFCPSRGHDTAAIRLCRSSRLGLINGEIPQPRAQPSAVMVRFAFGVKRRAIAGPRFDSWIGRFDSASADLPLSAPDGAGGKPFNVTVREAGVIQLRVKFAAATQPNCAVLWWQLFSVPISTRKKFSYYGRLLLVFVAHREAGGLHGKHNKPPPLLWSGCANMQNVVLTFGDGDSFTRIQQVEAMAYFQNTLVGRQRQRFSSASSRWLSLPLEAGE